MASSGLPAGELYCRTRADGWSPNRQLVRFTPGETTELTIRLPASAAVAGTVRSEAGEPLTGASIACGRYGSFEYYATKTDERGVRALRNNIKSELAEIDRAWERAFARYAAGP